jgi:hypothetical protein
MDFDNVLRTVRLPHVHGPKIRNQRWFAMAWLTVTAVFLGLILLASHIRMSDEVQATGVAENFMVAMQADAPGRAYDMTSPEFRKAVTEERLAQVFDQLGPVVRHGRIDMTDRAALDGSKDGKRVAVVYDVARGDQQIFLRLVLEKQGDGKWLLYNLYTSAQPMKARQGD